MEQIKITDMLTLRQEALRMAVMQVATDASSSDIISYAKDFESYLKGNAVLPEYVDTSKMFTDVMEKMNDRWNSSSQWISADSEMKPALNKQVLVMCEDSEYPYLSEYLGGDNWDVFDADVTKNTLQGEIKVLAWCPIPEYRPL